MTAPEPFDLVVIGSGPAGEKGAAQAAYFGKRVCLIEKAPKPGGAAVNTGTIPSKTLRETALYFSGLRQRGLYGVDLRVKQDITIGDFMHRERSVIQTEWGLIAENIARHGIITMQGSAKFIDSHVVEVSRYGMEARHVTAAVFLVATGSCPMAPSGYAVDGETIVDSDSLLTLQKIPETMIVVGGGVIGCEYACIFAALGVRVTIINSRNRLLAHLDNDVSDALRQSMTARLGVTVHGGVDVSGVVVENGRAHVTLADDTPSAPTSSSCARDAWATRARWGSRRSACARTRAASSTSIRTTAPRCRTSMRRATWSAFRRSRRRPWSRRGSLSATPST